MPKLNDAPSSSTLIVFISKDENMNTTNHWPGTTYGGCRRNHAARFGGVALDGCREFIPLSITTTTDPAALKCAACGCHRNFHQRVIGLPEPDPTSPLSPSPLSYCFSSARMLRLGLNLNEDPRSGCGDDQSRRSKRTSFSREQREKMRRFAEKLGWRLTMAGDETVRDFCKEIGVTRGVLRNWINNNKTKNKTVVARSSSPPPSDCRTVNAGILLSMS